MWVTFDPSINGVGRFWGVGPNFDTWVPCRADHKSVWFALVRGEIVGKEVGDVVGCTQGPPWSPLGPGVHVGGAGRRRRKLGGSLVRVKEEGEEE